LRPKPRWILGVALVVLSLVAGACGGDSDNNGTAADDSQKPVRGGKLVYGLNAETEGGFCLPEALLDTHGALVARAVYDTLTIPNDDNEYVPYLAESLTADPTKTTWTIKLRKGIKFHDGTDLTAQVVKNNLDAFRGAYPARKPQLFAAVFSNIADVQVMGEDGEALPYLDEIEFRPIVENAQRLNALQAGTVQAAFTVGTNSGPQIAQIRKLTADGKLRSTETNEQSEVGYILFNASKAPFDNLDARKAVAFAVDSERVNELRYGGLLPTANGPFAPGNVGYLKDTGYAGFDLGQATAAQKAYEQATGKPLTFTLSVSSDGDSVALAQLVKDMVEKTGAKVTLQPAQTAQVIEQALGGKYEASLWQNHPGGDPDTQFLWWHSKSPLNFGKLKDAEVDQLLVDGRTKTDPAERKRIYEDLNRLFAQKVYNAWMHWNLYVTATGPKVHGVVGPDLPDGSKPSSAMVAGHPTAGMWIEK
jgi:ABC-type transport system substrate-binding protein